MRRARGTIENHREQKLRYKADFATYGTKQNGVYKSIPWLIIRAPLGVGWNGYVSLQ